MKKLILMLAITALFAGLSAQTENLNTITGLTKSELYTDADVTLTEVGANNCIHINNDADVIIFRLPSARAGLTVGFYNNSTFAITIIPASGDNISLDGTALDVLDTIDSGGDKGEAIVLHAIDATTWITWGPGNGTWTDAGAE